MRVDQAFFGTRRAAAVIAALFALAAPVHAQQKPTAGQMAAAKEIIEIKGAMNLFSPLIPGVIEQAKYLFLRQNPNLQKDLDDVAAILRKEFVPRMSEIGDEVARLYATNFSEKEMKELVVFFKSPVGKKMLATEPQIAEQGIKFAQQWASKLSDEVITRMRAEMKKKGHEI